MSRTQTLSFSNLFTGRISGAVIVPVVITLIRACVHSACCQAHIESGAPSS